MDTVDSGLWRNIPRRSELLEHIPRLPAPDFRAFSTLTSISDIQAWTTAKAKEYRQITFAVLAIHNLAAPIHRLPTEVLELILEQCWEDWTSLRLPHVCRLWRSILLRNAAFWADAVADHELCEKSESGRNELPLVRTLLSRSTQGSHPIEPIFYTFSPSLAKLVSPYIGNVVSLELDLDKHDLNERLWPLLLSGMPNLETLSVQPMIMKEDISKYAAGDHHRLENHYSSAWAKLPMLSRKALPKLSTLTCPHVMVERFGDVTLKHLTVEWWDREKDNFRIPVIALGERGGLYLEPYSDTLETLEYALASCSSRPEQPLELPHLKYLFISSGISGISHILSWLSIPQTTNIHISAFDYYSNRDSSATVRLLVGTIGQVHLRLLPCRDQACETFFMECRAGDGRRVRLQVDDFSVAAGDGLLQFFGEDAPVKRLSFSAAESASPGAESRDRAVDLRAFPHLVDLDGCQIHMETLARMLQPDARGGCVEGEPGQAQAPTLPCPSLANLTVDIRCASVHRSVATSGSGGPATYESPSSLCRPDIVAGIDDLFQQQSDVLQRFIASRASSGSRLKSLDVGGRRAIRFPNQRGLADP